MAHINIKDVKHILDQERLKIKNPVNKFNYKAYILDKMHWLKFLTSEQRIKRVGELAHANWCGLMEEASITNSKYSLLFKNYYSKFRKIYFLRSKSEVPKYFKKYLKRLKCETGNKLQTLRIDNNLEYIN